MTRSNRLPINEFSFSIFFLQMNHFKGYDVFLVIQPNGMDHAKNISSQECKILKVTSSEKQITYWRNCTIDDFSHKEWKFIGD